MYTATVKLLLMCGVVLKNYHFVFAADEPTIRFPNGTIIPDFENIYCAAEEPLELFCIGVARDLRIIDDTAKVKEVPTTVVNETAIRLFLEKLTPESTTSYVCEDIKRSNSAYVSVTALSAPKVTIFRCKSTNLILNCTWTPQSEGCCKSSLYYVKDGHSTLLSNLSYNEPKLYLWDMKNSAAFGNEWSARTLNFMMETCNRIGCTNETFIIDHYAVMVLNPPEIIKILNKGSHSATLRVVPTKSAYDIMRKLHLGYDHRISYWYPGSHQIQVNTTSLPDFGYSYKLELILPCANTFYEVRVSFKLKTAIGEEYWSGDNVVTLLTDPESENAEAADDSACNRQEELKLTPEIMKYETVKLRIKVRDEQKKLKEMIEALKSKVKINKLEALNDNGSKSDLD